MNELELRHVAIIKAHAALHEAAAGTQRCLFEVVADAGECSLLLRAKTAINAAFDVFADEVRARERAINEATRLEGNTLARQCADLRDDLATVEITTLQKVDVWLRDEQRAPELAVEFRSRFGIPFDIDDLFDEVSA